jgi:hypothetical protein
LGAFHPGKFSDLLYGMPIEVAHLFTEVEIVFLITCFFWGVCGEYHSLLNVFLLPILLHQVKGATDSMGFVEVVDFRIEA